MAAQTRRGFACRRALVALALALAAWPGLAPDAASAVTVTDAQGRVVQVDDASRMVSVGGAVTEILYALGLQRHVVAVDTSSLYPPQAAREKPSVGYMRQLSAEGVLGLEPTLVLASEAAGPEETVALLKAAAVPLVLVPEHYSAQGVVEKIRIVARAAGAEMRGACLAARAERALARLAAVRARVERPLRVMFVLSFMNGRPMVAGRDTAADGIIRLAGALNAVDGYAGYKPVSDEAVIALRPDVVLAMERAGSELDADTVFSHPAFKLTPAAAGRRFVAMEGLYLLGFGPRTAHAARDLAAALYPRLQAPLSLDAAPAQEDCP